VLGRRSVEVIGGADEEGAGTDRGDDADDADDAGRAGDPAN